MASAASFSLLPPEIHRQIFSYVLNSRQTSTRKSVAIFGSRDRGFQQELALLNPVWRELIQAQLYEHLRLPHALTTAEEDIDELAEYVYRNSTLGSHIRLLTIDGPYGDQPTLAMWIKLKRLLKILNPTVRRAVYYQPYIGATSNGLLDALNIDGQTPLIHGEDERIMLEDEDHLEELRIGEVKGLRSLYFVCNVSYALEISQRFIRAVLHGMELDHFMMQSTDLRTKRSVRMEVFEGICTSINDRLLPAAVSGTLTGFKLQYTAMYPNIDLETYSRLFSLGEGLCKALGILSTHLVSFELVQAAISTALFQNDDGITREWPKLEYFEVRYSAINANGRWWNKLNDGLFEIVVPEEECFDPKGVDDRRLRRKRARRTAPDQHRWEEILTAASKALLAMPKVKRWTLSGASPSICLPKIVYGKLGPSSDELVRRYTSAIDVSDSLMNLWQTKLQLAGRGRLVASSDFY